MWTNIFLQIFRIRKIENLDGLINLKQLYLGKNKISKLDNLDCLVQLEILSIQSNRIVKVKLLVKCSLSLLTIKRMASAVIENDVVLFFLRETLYKR